MKIKPLYDRVLIRRLEGSTTSKGGIIIPDSAKKAFRRRSYCRRRWSSFEDGSTRPLTVKEGDKVLSPNTQKPKSITTKPCCCFAKKTFWA